MVLLCKIFHFPIPNKMFLTWRRWGRVSEETRCRWPWRWTYSRWTRRAPSSPRYTAWSPTLGTSSPLGGGGRGSLVSHYSVWKIGQIYLNLTFCQKDKIINKCNFPSVFSGCFYPIETWINRWKTLFIIIFAHLAEFEALNNYQVFYTGSLIGVN